jgi:uncharacterized cupin superfamily protein
METRQGHLAETPLQASPPRAIRPDWYVGRRDARLGQLVGLNQFGVNYVILEPGARSALRHWHEQEDEFVYVLSGELVLIDENGEHRLTAGGFVGFPAGAPNAHHLANLSSGPASYIEVGTRKVGIETLHYPDDFEEPRTVERDASGKRVAR